MNLLIVGGAACAGGSPTAHRCVKDLATGDKGIDCVQWIYGISHSDEAIRPDASFAGFAVADHFL